MYIFIVVFDKKENSLIAITSFTLCKLHSLSQLQLHCYHTINVSMKQQIGQNHCHNAFTIQILNCYYYQQRQIANTIIIAIVVVDVVTRIMTWFASVTITRSFSVDVLLQVKANEIAG